MLYNRNPLDPYLGIKHEAWMILHALQVHDRLKLQLEKAYHVSTFALYNGRETAIGIEVEGSHELKKPKGKRRLILYFTENRNSDSLIVQHAFRDGGINPPALSDFDAESYNNRAFFAFNDHIKVGDYIADLVEAHLTPEVV